jgi:flagellar hook-basal body complex protein FliE
MSIPAIGALGASLPTSGLSGLNAMTGLSGSTGTEAIGSASGGGFAQALQNGVQSLTDVQTKADQLGVQAATGDLTDVHDYMIAATQAELTTELTVAVRNKALDAFNEIMRMQA